MYESFVVCLAVQYTTPKSKGGPNCFPWIALLYIFYVSYNEWWHKSIIF